MAEPLKHFFSPALVRRLGSSIAAVRSDFDAGRFVRRASRGLDDLELMERSRHIMEALRAELPSDYPSALAVLLRSVREPKHDAAAGGAMAPFFYLPHVQLVQRYGLGHVELSLDAQEELTQHFTCEWSIRPYLEQDPTLLEVRLARWARHDSEHVRRLVSEGTRIRLPWAGRIPTWEKRLPKIVALLEALKDDPSSYVRRSVANNLNDIAKVDPSMVVEVAGRWLAGATERRRALVEHALRTLVKRSHAGALALLGFQRGPRPIIESASFSPKRVRIGESVLIGFELVNASRQRAAFLVDLAVIFVKLRGVGRKVFKLSRVTLGPGERVSFRKKISLAVHTTRKPQPGKHLVEVLVNGEPSPLGSFAVYST